MDIKKGEILVGQIKQAISQLNMKKFNDRVFDLDIFLMECQSFPDSILDSLVEILGSMDFMDLVGGSVLMSLLKDNIEILDGNQIDKIVIEMQANYENLQSSPMGISYGEFFVDALDSKRSLEVFKALMTVESEDPRGWIPYGICYFISNCSDDQLKKEAFDLLKILLSDKSKFVRGEAKVHFEMLEEGKNSG